MVMPVLATQVQSKKPERATVIVIISIVCLLAMIKVVEVYVRSARATVSTARHAVEAATDKSVKAQAEVVAAKAEVQKTKAESIREVDQIMGAYESETEIAPTRTGRKGWVYLGICTDRWFKLYFSGLPPCADGPLQEPIKIKSLRGVKVRAAPPTQAGVGTEVNRIKDQGSVRLVRMAAISQTIPNAPQIYWGEIEFP